jgi:hypothetical protein
MYIRYGTLLLPRATGELVIAPVPPSGILVFLQIRSQIRNASASKAFNVTSNVSGMKSLFPLVQGRNVLRPPLRFWQKFTQVLGFCTLEGD